jgi:hypothetical protein
MMSLSVKRELLKLGAAAFLEFQMPLTPSSVSLSRDQVELAVARTFNRSIPVVLLFGHGRVEVV